MENARQELIVRDKKELTLNGVINVLDFSELEMTIETALSIVVVEGEEMKIESLSKDDGVIHVNGRIEGFYYKRQREKKRIFSKQKG